MSIAAVKSSGWGQRIYAFVLALILSACSGSTFNATKQVWKTYRNPRYNFEFPYPSKWTPVRPDNNDGIAFISPRNQAVEIQSWAGNQLPESIIGTDTKKTIDPNFRTAQGISGVLTVEVGKQESAMGLRITQKRIKYYWYGKAPSKEFGNYYSVFYYIAQQYRVPEEK